MSGLLDVCTPIRKRVPLPICGNLDPLCQVAPGFLGAEQEPSSRLELQRAIVRVIEALAGALWDWWRAATGRHQGGVRPTASQVFIQLYCSPWLLSHTELERHYHPKTIIG